APVCHLPTWSIARLGLMTLLFDGVHARVLSLGRCWLHKEEAMSASAGDVVSRNVSMGEYLKRRYEQTSRALACRARSEQEWLAWREGFKRKLTELMAPWPEPCPLEPITLDRVQRDGFVQEKVLFNSEPDMAVPAYVLI